MGQATIQEPPKWTVLEDGRSTGYAKLEGAVLEGENLLEELPVSANTESERGVGLLDHRVTLFSIFSLKEKRSTVEGAFPYCAPQWLYQFPFPPTV